MQRFDMQHDVQAGETRRRDADDKRMHGADAGEARVLDGDNAAANAVRILGENQLGVRRQDIGIDAQDHRMQDIACR